MVTRGRRAIGDMNVCSYMHVFEEFASTLRSLTAFFPGGNNYCLTLVFDKWQDKLSSIYVFSYFPFGFEGRIWDLIVSVPDHCLSFYLTIKTMLVRDLIF